MDSILEFHVRDKRTEGLPLFLSCISLAYLVFVLIMEIGGGHPNIFGIVFLSSVVTAPSLLLALYYVDFNTQKYLLSGTKLSVTHPKFPFLNRHFELKEFTQFKVTQAKGCKVLRLYREQGSRLSIPILGTIPELIKAIDAVHQMQEKTGSRFSY